MNQTLKGRKAIVTGASQGLGLEIAAAFLANGADVCICGRDAGTLEKAAEKLREKLPSGSQLVVELGDVSKEAAVERIVSSAAKAFGNRVDILVNNAGVLGPTGGTEEVEWQEWLRTIEINLFGSVLMSRAVIPFMKKARYGKIMQLSGGGATQPMPRFSAYAASKAAIVRFADTLAQELRADNIDVNSVAPGAMNTRLLDEVLEAGPEKVGQEYYDRCVKQRDSGGAPLERAVALAVFLASQESDGITGKLIAALWDNWEDFPKHKEDLSKSDVYSIRRIIGKDRGYAWGDK